MLDKVKSKLNEAMVRLQLSRLPKAPALQRPTINLGHSSYGSWTFCPDLVPEKGVIYSFGVGEDISWDLAMIERYGVTVHAFDPTPRAAEFVRKQALPEQFVFHEYGLASYDGVARFFPPENPEWVSHTMLERKCGAGRVLEVPVRRLASIMSSLGHDRIDLIKMDIEGAEYAVMEDILESAPVAGGAEQLLVEFHHRLEGKGVGDTLAAIASLERKGFRYFHISASTVDWGFVRCD